MKYYIYHIEGVKIGCSKNPRVRVKAQGYDNFVILEEHSDAIIAGEREIELQSEFGYRVDKFNYSIVSNKSDETRLKMSKSKIGTKQSEEAKKKRSESLKGNRNALGKKLSDETRKKMSESRKGMVSVMLGKKHSEDTKKKMSESRKGRVGGMLGKKVSDETKKKISDKTKERNKNYCIYQDKVYSCEEICMILGLTRRQVINIKSKGRGHRYNLTFIKRY